MSIEYDFGFAEPTPVFHPAPPADDAERLARLRLIRSRRVGPTTYMRLLGEHGSAREALHHLPEVAKSAGVSDYTACPEPVALAEVKAAKRSNARMLCLGDPDYPIDLSQIADPPPVLWAMGDVSVLSKPLIAIVGTRNASSLGARMAKRLAKDLGDAGFVVVSGLARGIDAIAHHAALVTGTIAVHAGGLDIIYPSENSDLAKDIGRQGLRLSEMPFGMEPRARHFPKRNRIVSGLSLGVIVVEAATRSGSMITARAGLDQGREVMAVPGHPLDSRASGGNTLLRDGATMVRHADDVLDALNPVLAQRNQPVLVLEPSGQDALVGLEAAAIVPVSHPNGVEGAILASLTATAIAEDQLVRDLGHPPRAIAQALAILELAGRVRRSAGGLVQLA